MYQNIRQILRINCKQLLELYNHIIQRQRSSMDRLFGKQLSNLLNHNVNSRQRNSLRLHSKSSRGLNINDPLSKNGQRKINKSTVSHNISMRVQKSEQPIEVKQPIQELKNVQLVPEYFDECLGFMLQQEQADYNLTNYMSEQTNITDKMRGILFEWIADLHYKFKMFPETLYTVSMIIDKFLIKKEATKQNLQLIGTAAFFIAAKYEETYQVPELQDLVQFAAKAFSKKDIIQMEAEIIEALDFNLIMTTSFKFFEPLAKISKMDPKNFHLAQYVLELAMLQTKFLEYKPSILASSAIYLINKIRKRNQAWPDILLAATNYEQKQLKACARELCYILERADQIPNTKSLKKKFGTAQFHEVTRIKLERRGTKN